MNWNLASRTKKGAAVIATVLLAAGLFVNPAYADDKNPTPSPQPTPGTSEKQSTELPKNKDGTYKTGTREDSENIAKAAEDAYQKYQQACVDGSDKGKRYQETRQYAWGWYKELLHTSLWNEALKVRENREARENLDHYQAALKRLQDNPNSSASDIATAEADVKKATKKFQKLMEQTISTFEAELKTKYTYDGPEACPAPGTTPQPEKKKKKKDKGETSGPLDFFGDVSIGVGVGGHRERHEDSRRSHEKDRGEEKAGKHKDQEDKEHDNASHESEEQGHDKGISHESGSHDEHDKSRQDRNDHEHEDNETAPTPQD